MRKLHGCLELPLSRLVTALGVLLFIHVHSISCRPTGLHDDRRSSQLQPRWPLPPEPSHFSVLHARNASEHVVLADCLSNSGVVSSQMAYFPTSTGPTPQDVAVVETTSGQAALWVSANTTALFTDTGVSFTATLGPKQAEGAFAGTGTNGYANFSCWQGYVRDLYDYGGNQCAQVYVCDHRVAPAQTSIPAVADPDLSVGAVIGIAVGSAVVFLILLVLGGWFVLRRRRSKRTDQLEAAQPPTDEPPAVMEADSKKIVQYIPAFEMDATHHRFEVGDDRRPELGGDDRRGELDASSAVSPIGTAPGSVSPLSASPRSDGLRLTRWRSWG